MYFSGRTPLGLIHSKKQNKKDERYWPEVVPFVQKVENKKRHTRKEKIQTAID